jgi:hypothetical protein
VFDGLVGQTIAWDLSNSNDYTVPAGKNLFIINVWATIGYYFNIDGKVVLGHDSWGEDGNGNGHSAKLKLPLCVKSGEVVSYTSSNVEVPPSFYGILTDAVVDPISFEFGNVGSGNESYVVPVGKTLVITNVWNYSQNSVLTIDGGNVLTGLWNESLAAYASAQQLEIPLFINSGLVIGMPDNTASFNGYLVDEDYFADCGGGGSSEVGGDAESVTVVSFPDDDETPNDISISEYSRFIIVDGPPNFGNYTVYVSDMWSSTIINLEYSDIDISLGVSSSSGKLTTVTLSASPPTSLLPPPPQSAK